MGSSLGSLSLIGPALMTGQRQETRPRTQRGLCRPLLPAEVRAPPVAGRKGGVSCGPSSSWEGAGKGRDAQRMCGSACLPGGGAASPALPLTASPPLWNEGYHHPGKPWEVMGRGTCSDLSRAERPGWCRFGSYNPLPSVNTAPNSRQTRRRPDASVLPGGREPGDSRDWGCRE